MDECKWGFVDFRGEMAVPFRFESCFPFSGGISLVVLDGMRGYIDHSGSFVINPEFGENSREFRNNHVVVEVASGKMKFIDRGGRFLLDESFYYAEHFEEGIASVEYEEGVCACIRVDGSRVAEGFHHCGSFASGFGLAMYGPREHWFLDALGNRVAGPYESASRFRGQRAIVFKDGTYRILFTDLTERELSGEFDSLGIISGGRLTFYRDDKEGYMNLDGEIVIPAVFDEARTFKEGRACVRVGDSWGIIDLAGDWVSAGPKYGWIDYCSEGLIRCRLKNDETIFLDRNGNVVLHSKQVINSGFREGLAVAGSRPNGWSPSYEEY